MHISSSQIDPLVSVVASFYNSESSIDVTISSVIEQTFRDFEIICINDASKDKTSEILNEWKDRDNRIIVIKNDTNLGLTRSLNKGIKAARGKYIARIDAGDMWLKDKLLEQINFFDNNEGYILCGTQAVYINEEDQSLGVSNFSLEDADIRRRFMTQEGTFLHPTVMFRNCSLYYNEYFKYSQDLDLYMRLSLKGKLKCLDKPLIKCRVDVNGLTITKKYYQRQYINIINNLYKKYYLNGITDIDLSNLKIRDNIIERFFFKKAMVFYKRYVLTKTIGQNTLLWMFYLSLSCIIYPPFMKDYAIRLSKHFTK